MKLSFYLGYSLLFLEVVLLMAHQLLKVVYDKVVDFIAPVVKGLSAKFYSAVKTSPVAYNAKAWMYDMFSRQRVTRYELSI